MINKKLSVVSLILFIFAGLFLAFAIWAAYKSFEYIAELTAMGQVVISENLYNITSFHMANFGQYVVFALVLFGMGWIVQILSAPKTAEVLAGEEDFDSMAFELEDLEDEDDEA